MAWPSVRPGHAIAGSISPDRNSPAEDFLSARQAISALYGSIGVSGFDEDAIGERDIVVAVGSTSKASSRKAPRLPTSPDAPIPGLKPNAGAVRRW